MKEIKLIIGLGNPDKQYLNTYHNVGFLFVDYFGRGYKSDTYMNKSGIFVAKMMKKQGVKPEELLIVHDDSDITLGNYKISHDRGAAGHHGIESIQAAIKSNKFWRLRIGIRPKADLPAGARRAKAGEFVLKKISSGDKKILEKVFEEIAKELK